MAEVPQDCASLPERHDRQMAKMLQEACDQTDLCTVWQGGALAEMPQETSENQQAQTDIENQSQGFEVQTGTKTKLKE